MHEIVFPEQWPHRVESWDTVPSLCDSFRVLAVARSGRTHRGTLVLQCEARRSHLPVGACQSAQPASVSHQKGSQISKNPSHRRNWIATQLAQIQEKSQHYAPFVRHTAAFS